MFPLERSFNNLSLQIEQAEQLVKPHLVRCAALDKAQRESIALITGVFREQISAINKWISTERAHRDIEQIKSDLKEQYSRIHQDYVADYISLLSARECFVEDGKVIKLTNETKSRLTQEFSDRAQSVLQKQLDVVDFTKQDDELLSIAEYLKKQVDVKVSQAGTLLDQKTRITNDLLRIMRQTEALCRIKRDLLSGEPKDIWQACEVGAVEFLRAACASEKDRKAFVNQKHSTGVSLLHIAARHGQCEMADWLISSGADPLQRSSEGYIPLHWAAQRGNPSMVWCLLQAAPGSGTVRGEYGRTPLHMAAHNGHIEVAHILLKSGVDLNAQEDEGITPLHEAVMCNEEAMVDFLLQHDAIDVNMTNRRGFTPLCMAIINCNEGFVALILGHASWKPLESLEGLLKQVPDEQELIRSMLVDFYAKT